jgi:opacity protein-like surface antigen
MLVRLTRPVQLTLTVGILVLLASSARAQSDAGTIASGSLAAGVVDGGAHASIAGSLGYRFNRVIGLGIELTWIPTLKPALPGNVPSPYPSIVYSDPSGDALFFTTNVRIEIPTTSRRVIPFAIGGGGVASTTQRYALTVTFVPPVPVVPVGLVVSPPTLPPTILPIQSRPVTTSTGLALTLGGGVSLLATDHFSIDVDLRSLYIRGNPNGAIGRFGLGASYRF